jgi:NAD-dependent dihydropyrimidine dehydrogenase PreA subunit
VKVRPIPLQNFMELYKFLPKTNCKICGKTCMAFSLDLIKGNVKIDDCSPLLEQKYKQKYDSLKELIEVNEDKKKELRVEVDEKLCDGCGICVSACSVNARYCPPTLSGKTPDYPHHPYQIFQIINGKCELLNLEHCKRLEKDSTKKNCRICETYCPRKAIKIEFV